MHSGERREYRIERAKEGEEYRTLFTTTVLAQAIEVARESIVSDGIPYDEIVLTIFRGFEFQELEPVDALYLNEDGLLLRPLDHRLARHIFEDAARRFPQYVVSGTHLA